MRVSQVRFAQIYALLAQEICVDLSSEAQRRFLGGTCSTVMNVPAMRTWMIPKGSPPLTRCKGMTSACNK
ncbi:hypothetical protein MESS4_20063 [Mesorhizobium sp. STM 4661]|nr:hypothetical protein MESS4_20063 [Mesorhizobium sp. STM 4661]